MLLEPDDAFERGPVVADEDRAVLRFLGPRRRGWGGRRARFVAADEAGGTSSSRDRIGEGFGEERGI